MCFTIYAEDIIMIVFQIVGMLITYFVLLIQFSPSEDSNTSQGACNCTNT